MKRFAIITSMLLAILFVPIIASAATNLVSNGDFSQQDSSFLFFGNPPYSVNNGVLEMSRPNANSGAIVAQFFTGVSTNQNTVVQATVDLGNNDNQYRGVRLLVGDTTDYAQANGSVYCDFSVPPTSQMQTYTLRLTVPANWDETGVGLFLLSQTNASIRIDNLDVHKNPTSSSLGCFAGPVLNTNLVSNSGFSSGMTDFVKTGMLNVSAGNGELAISRVGAGGTAVVGQIMDDMPFTSGSKFYATVDLGNSGSQTKTVRLAIADVPNMGNANYMLACTFEVPPVAAKYTYELSGTLPADWVQPAVGVFVDDTLGGSVLVDNLTLQYQQTNTNINTIDCVAPDVPVAPGIGDCLTAEEAQLVSLINNYRQQNGLGTVPVSKSLVTVAQYHVRDLHNYRPDTGTDNRGQACNLHSWSANGPWSPVCYTSDHFYASGMWDKPEEITNGIYTGSGFENAYGAFGFTATAQNSFSAWQNSPLHNAVILEQNGWSGYNWPAMGVGIYEGYAVLWFGNTSDPQGSVGQCANGQVPETASVEAAQTAPVASGPTAPAPLAPPIIESAE